jgi:hypothetical protein
LRAAAAALNVIPDSIACTSASLPAGPRAALRMKVKSPPRSHLLCKSFWRRR